MRTATKPVRTGQRTSQKGFGLAEVLLASGILILVVASIVSLSRFITRGYSLTQRRTTATYFAQEGLDAVRSIRDSYWIDEDPETDFSSLPRSGTYRVGWSPSAGWILSPTTAPVEVSWNTDPATGVRQTVHSRNIEISDVSNDPDIDDDLEPHMKRVIVTVDWFEGGRTNTVVTESFLTDWRLES